MQLLFATHNQEYEQLHAEKRHNTEKKKVYTSISHEFKNHTASYIAIV